MLSGEPSCPEGPAERQDWRLSSEATGAAGWRSIICPGLALLPPGLEEIATLLPLADLNGVALSYCGNRAGTPEPGQKRGQDQPGALALMMSDPFLNPGRIADTLRAAGMDTVINWPSCQILDGDTARAVASAGLGVAREAAMIAEFSALGFRTLGLVRGAGHGALMAKAGATQIVLHPGIALRDWRSRAMAARLLDEEMQASAGLELPLLVFRSRGYGSELDAVISRSAGVVSLGEAAI